MAQSCMTQDLFLYIEPKHPVQKTLQVQSKPREKTAGAGIAVVDTQNSSNHSKVSNERGEDHRQRIAGRN